ncbi:hypothetical protein INT48_003816 [Thamnidium elegans]|uniref:Dilute domain-containing protein n=1 Tax=Thamnidium elegans TaxID=101142 RepID=A0A8H7VYL7_9FUNG|nr:hypothetical protein INT48_003816 [Thamnidium elegans]
MTNDITTADEGENLRKQYENMSYNEMSLKLAENYKQLQELLGNRISIPTTEESSDYEEEDDEEEEEEVDIEQQQKEEKTKLFLKSVSSGDVEKVKYYLEQEIDDIDINGKDEDGTTPLIYAACFGKFEISQLLLSAGANIDNQDGLKLLLENGASSQTKSAKGRTVLDFVKNDTHKIADMVIASSISNRDSISSTSSIMGFTAAGSNSSTSSNAGDNDRYYQYSTEENYESFINHDSESRPKLIEEYLLSTNNNNNEQESDSDDYSENDNDSEEEDIKSFDWDKCMPDQMFVFGADNLPYILDTVISKLTLPIRNSNTQNVHILSYWMTNITRLLYYLKKDVQLVVATAEYQLRLSELISETYNHIVNDTGKRITQILEPSMLEHDPISGMMEEVNFVDDWQRFFRRSNSKSEDMQRTNSSQLSSSQSINSIIVMSPKSIIQLFSSTYYVLQSYEVHSTIIIQAIAQFLHLLSCELFNQILSKRKYLCRSKAIQIRMNLSVIEEWIRNNNLPASLISYLNPSIQLVQLLQCISQLDTVSSFQSTIKLFDSINSLQIRRCVINYRYETNEPRLPEEIEKLVQQTFDETIRLKQARQSRSFERRRRSGPPLLNNQQSQSLRRSLSNRAESNITQIMGSILLSRSSINITDEKPLTLPTDQDEEVEDKEINETKDARFMLPFFVPTTTQLSVTKDEFLLIPVIPENWMDKLDHSEK